MKAIKACYNFRAVKYQDYVKLPLNDNPLKFPWKLGGLSKFPEEQEFDCFIDYNRVIDETKVKNQIGQFVKLITEKDFSKYQSLIEFSLAKQLRNEIDRVHKQQHTLQITLDSIDNITLYNLANVYRIGVFKNRSKNQQSKIAHFNMEIDGKNFQAFFKKHPRQDDRAYISLLFDISFNADVHSLLRNEQGSIIFENQNKEIHSLTFEIDVVQSDYRSLKNNLEDGQFLKNYQNKLSNEHLIIVDIDNFLDGNPYKRKIEKVQ